MIELRLTFDSFAEMQEMLDKMQGETPASTPTAPPSVKLTQSEQDRAQRLKASLVERDMTDPVLDALMSGVDPSGGLVDPSTQLQRVAFGIPYPPEAAMPTEDAQRAPAPPAVEESQTAAPTAGVDTDANGLPWDGRIHSSSQKKNADGTWRAKRGVDPDTVTGVEAELKGIMSAPATSAAPPPPPPAGDNSDPGMTPGDFGTLMREITRMQNESGLTNDTADAAAQELGLPNMIALVNRPDLIPAYWRQLNA